MQALELQILDAIQRIRTPILDTVMVYASLIANRSEVWIAAGLLLLIYDRRQAQKQMRYTELYRVDGEQGSAGMGTSETINTGVSVLFAMALCYLIVNVTLKPLIARIRPYELSDSVKLLVPMLQDYSFPSGHSASSFAAAVAIFLNRRAVGIAALCLASLIAFSRLYLYVHYPSDVLAGILIGTACAIIAVRLQKNAAEKNISRQCSGAGRPRDDPSERAICK